MMRLYRLLLTFLGLLAGLVFGMLTLIIGLDVIGRNLGWFNLPWVLEISEYVLYGATFLAAPWVLAENAHVRVDILIGQLPAGLARWLDAGMNLCGLLISAVLVYYGVLATWDSYRLGSLIFKELIFPEWWLLWIMPLSGLLLGLEFIRRGWQAFTRPGNATPSDNYLPES